MRNDNTIQIRISSELKERLAGKNISELVREHLETLVPTTIRVPEVDSNRESRRVEKPQESRIKPSIANVEMNPMMRKFLESDGKKG